MTYTILWTIMDLAYELDTYTRLFKIIGYIQNNCSKNIILLDALLCDTISLNSFEDYIFS